MLEPVKSWVPVHVLDADFKFVNAVPTKEVVAGALELSPAVLVATVTVELEKKSGGFYNKTIKK